METDYKALFDRITRRYGSVDPEALERVLCPVLIPLNTLDRTATKVPGQKHFRASFSITIEKDYQEVIQRGRTGKFVPRSHLEGAAWREVAKGRILDVNHAQGVAVGEVYIGTGSTKGEMEAALKVLSANDYLEIDQYGAAAKLLSGLVEYYFSKAVRDRGFEARRMPEDIARHVGAYYHYDFAVTRGSEVKRVEVKSLWGTNTHYARLIHSKTKDYPTSSCKFDTQDMFAVSLFLRTGNIRDFAFARSVPKDLQSYGLPWAPKHRNHVHQNPPCVIGDGTWFSSIEEVWNLE